MCRNPHKKKMYFVCVDVFISIGPMSGRPSIRSNPNPKNPKPQRCNCVLYEYVLISRGASRPNCPPVHPAKPKRCMCVHGFIPGRALRPNVQPVNPAEPEPEPELCPYFYCICEILSGHNRAWNHSIEYPHSAPETKAMCDVHEMP